MNPLDKLIRLYNWCVNDGGTMSAKEHLPNSFYKRNNIWRRNAAEFQFRQIPIPLIGTHYDPITNLQLMNIFRNRNISMNNHTYENVKQYWNMWAHGQASLIWDTLPYETLNLDELYEAMLIYQKMKNTIYTILALQNQITGKNLEHNILFELTDALTRIITSFNEHFP